MALRRRGPSSPQMSGKGKRSDAMTPAGGLLRDVRVPSPVRLKQDTIDLLQIDDLGSVAYGLEQGAET
ncbi:MAG: hypothetical protein ABJB12_11960 [Pseudomonadota bacterium]